VTKQCRGLIVRGNWMHPDAEVVARPFPKFANLGECDGVVFDRVPEDRPFDVTVKLDGSLGILYRAPDGQPAIATRGSFTSEQALWATEHWRQEYLSSWRDPYIPHEGRLTLLFEIIYPGNRIVVDYGERESLELIAAIDNETGADEDIAWLGPRAPRLDGLTDISEIAALAAASPEEYVNQEGFVLRFAPETPGQSSVRVKVKFSEYVRLHRIVTGVSSKTIWESLRDNRPLTDLLDRVPDEFYAWVQDTVEDLRRRYDAIESDCRTAFDARPQTTSRRDIATVFQSHPHRSVLFRMLDGRDYSDLIWRAIRPTYERPFRVDVDA
jgi:RNA ligase